MKCPLSAVRIVDGYGQVHLDQVECSKEECAWWIEYIPPDGEPHAACALVHIADRLFTIVAKLPTGKEMTL